MNAQSLKIPCIALLLSISLVLTAQEKGSVFHNIEKKHGLSSSSISSVLRDRDGFYWIATQNGLNRYDGSNIRVFYSNRHDTNSLSHNHCTTLLEDNNGDIWIGTLYGLNHYSKKENRFIRIILQHPGFLTDRLNWIGNLALDHEGNIWISSYGLWRYDLKQKKLESFFPPASEKGLTNTNKLNGIIFDARFSGLWGVTTHGFFYFDIDKKTFHHRESNPLQRKFFTYSEFAAFTLDSSGAIWYHDVANKTLCRYDPEADRMELHTVPFNGGPRRLFSDDKGRIWIFFWNRSSILFDPETGVYDSTVLSDVHVQSPLNDRPGYFFAEPNGNYWFCSSVGISIYDRNRQHKKYLPLPQDNQTAREIFVNEVSQTDQNREILWMRTPQGLYRLNLVTQQMKPIFLKEFQEYISGIMAFKDSILFVSTENMLYRYNHVLNRIEKRYRGKFNITTSMLTDQYDHLWVSNWVNGLYKFDQDLNLLKHFSAGNTNTGASLKSENIINLSRFYPGQNLFFIGYNGGNGYAEVYTEDDRLVNHHIQLHDSSAKMVANTVNCFGMDKEGRLWIGTFGGGLYIRNQEGSYDEISQADGLKSDFINSIIPDRHGDLWISTSDGMNIIREGIVINPGNEISIHSSDFMKNSISLADGGILAIDAKQVLVYYPDAYRERKEEGKVLISEFRIFNKTEALPGKEEPVSLRYRQNFFSIDFSLTKTDPEEAIRYRYMLKGFDKDWVQTVNRNGAAYTNVPPGSYEFVVQAADINGNWIFASDPMMISITPPFWKTWWFYAACFLLIISAGYFIYRYRIGQLKKILAIRNKISQDLHDEVGASLSSIHVYSSVAAKTLDTDSSKSRVALQLINVNTRQVMENMNDIVWAINANEAGNSTLEAKLKNYGYELLAPLNIQCSYQIAKDAEKKLSNIEARKNILLIAKEAINNIAKYSAASSAVVRLEILHKTLQMEISDNGRGFDLNNGHTGNGIENMKQRSRSIGGNLSVHTLPDKGTTVTLNVTLANISE